MFHSVWFINFGSASYGTLDAVTKNRLRWKRGGSIHGNTGSHGSSEDRTAIEDDTAKLCFPNTINIVGSVELEGLGKDYSLIWLPSFFKL